MRILITGGFGYLGGRLAQYLQKDGRAEIILGSRQEFESPAWLRDARVAVMNWDSSIAIEKNLIDVDVVIHLAGMNASACSGNPVSALEFNAVATARLVHAASRQRVRRVLYVSTAHVYKEPLTGVIDEACCTTSLHPYATSHRAGEDSVLYANRKREIEGVVVRLSNAYGAPTHVRADCWMLLVNDLCHQAVTTGRMVLHSSGMQRRDFVAISEFCRAIHHLIASPLQDPSGAIFNMGGEWSPTVWELACHVQERCNVVLGFRPELTRQPSIAGESTEPLDFQIDRLRKSGFTPNPDRVGELDRLLVFCRDSFGRREDDIR